MPNMDGTGPNRGGYSMHGAMGFGHGRQGHGAFHGVGHRATGCRCGLGPCAQGVPDEKTVLEARKEALKRNLSAIEQRLETL